MSQYQTEEKNRIKRQRSETAIRLATEGRWADALAANQELMHLFPDDTETLNRIGKSFLELKRFSEARTAYEESLRLDANNMIAQKNLQRLSQVTAAPVETIRGTPKAAESAEGIADTAHNETAETVGEVSAPGVVAPSLFIEETGKTGRTHLTRLAGSDVLAKLTAADQVQFEIVAQTGSLVVKTQEGDYIGEVEPKMAQRLIRFIQAGNRYSVFLTSVRPTEIEIIIRETFQHPSMRGKLSFPPGKNVAIRGYTKDLVVSRYDEEGDDEDGTDTGDDDDDDDEAEEETEPENEFEDEAENLSGR